MRVSHSFGQQKILAEWAGITGKPGLNSSEPLNYLTYCNPPILNEYVISQVGLLPFVSQLGHNLNWRVSHGQKNQEPAHFSGMLIKTHCSDHLMVWQCWEEPFSWEGSLCFFSAGFETNISANSCNFLDANHQPPLPSNSYFVRSRITLINANMGQDHFQEHPVQVFAAVTKNKNRL